MALLNRERIIYQELTDDMQCGIYGIYSNDKLIYIGKSTQMEQRWQSHSAKIISGHFAQNDGMRRQATLRCLWENGFIISFKVLKVCKPDELSQLEQQYIQKYQPLLNTVYNPVEMEKHKQRLHEKYLEFDAYVKNMKEWNRKALEYWGPDHWK